MYAETKQHVAFAGNEIIVRGEIAEVVRRCKARLDGGEESRIALYDDANGRAIDIDYLGGAADVLARLGDHPILGESVRKPPAGPPDQTTKMPRGCGRPKLGGIAPAGGDGAEIRRGSGAGAQDRRSGTPVHVGHRRRPAGI